MAPFIVLTLTDEASAAAWEALGVTAEELLARDDLADILLNQPAGRHWTNQLEDTGYALYWKHDRSGIIGSRGGWRRFSPWRQSSWTICWLDLVVVDRQAVGTTAELVKPNSQQPWKRSASLQRSFLHAGFWQTGIVAVDVVTVNDVTRHSCGCRHQRWCDPQH